MKAIRFLRDYQGVLTGEKFHLEGAVIPADTLFTDADALVADGRAEFVDPSELEDKAKEESPKAETKSKPKRKPRKKAKK